MVSKSLFASIPVTNTILLRDVIGWTKTQIILSNTLMEWANHDYFWNFSEKNKIIVNSWGKKKHILLSGRIEWLLLSVSWEKAIIIKTWEMYSQYCLGVFFVASSQFGLMFIGELRETWRVHRVSEQKMTWIFGILLSGNVLMSWYMTLLVKWSEW